ncbi:amidase [Minwuia sp.]|uniref:amidase n=1 Tax=Minwuia sp. TaxID=2493630 RepID=UPI003A91EE17
MTDLTELDLVELSDLIDAGKTSAGEITDAFLTRIERENAQTNAYVTLTADNARAAAKQADQQISSGKRRGTLHGLPIGHKDLYATAGVLTTGGSRVLADNVPVEDATAVARLNDAGMVTLGKLNTHEFAYGPTGENSSFGTTRNPWNLDRITGGSSSGSAAAVAGGLAPVATGSDTGGSIRMPAACCGLTGLKPTYGRVPRSGILPLCWSMDHSGPLSRTAIDAALILQATAGADGKDAAAPDRPVPDYLSAMTGDISGLKIGVARRYFFDQAQTQVTDRVEDALKELEKRGAKLVDVDIAHIEHSTAAALAIYLAEATAYHEDTLDRNADLFTDQVRTYLEVGDQILAKDYLHAQRFRTLLGQSMAAVLEDVDVIATPGIAMTATPIGELDVDINGTPEPVFGAILRNTEPFDMTGLPALVVPCGFGEDGLPVSLQLASRPFDEATILNAGHAYQQATDWHRRRPG